MNKQLEAKLKTLPDTPGVYFHKDASGEVIYVGKAANLRNRVRQYFQNSRDKDTKTQALVAEIADTDWTQVETELDALFLESEMIKRYMPRWNVLLRDDKSHTYVRIDMKSDWPTLTYSRNPLDDGAEYIGPYYSTTGIKQALRYLRRIFPYLTKKPKAGERPSLDAHLGLEPDVDKTTSAEYKAGLRNLIRVIEGGRKQVLKELERSMNEAAKNQDFEQAAAYRNQVFNLKALQKQILFGDKEFLDISKDQALVELKELLGLEKIPARIEGYDISHQSGTNVVGSMVVFKNGASSRADYRKFKMKAQRNDDTANMRETIQRRLKHLSDWGKPDLVIIDGGQGQLGAVGDLLKEKNIPFIGRNKSGDHGKNADTSIIVPLGGGYTPLIIANNSHIVKLIARIDDESHRFAVSYHTILKRKAQTQGALDDIAGIGPKTKSKLLKKFGSVAKIKAADEAELAKLIGAKKAKIISSALQGTTL